MLSAVLGRLAPQLRTVLSSVACWSVRGAGLVAGARRAVVLAMSSAATLQRMAVIAAVMMTA